MRRFFLIALSATVLCSLPDWGATGIGADLLTDPGLSDFEKTLGIRILSLRPTAFGQMLDLRFQVLDSVKAKPVLDKNRKPHLLDPKSGKQLPVPVTKSGSMRQTTLAPEAGRVYFTLFANPGGVVKENGRVTLVIGNLKMSDIIVNTSAEIPVSAARPAAHRSVASGNP